MDLWEFYDRVERLIVDLRERGHVGEAERVETAIRGGAMASEILGRLSLALPEVAATVPEVRAEVNELESFARQALRRRT